MLSVNENRIGSMGTAQYGYWLQGYGEKSVSNGLASRGHWKVRSPESGVQSVFD